MDIDYESLRVLEAVVRTGSFEHAAKSLEVTQSAVSQRIKQLEDRVGSLLVTRGRPCVPTEDGLLLCQHVEQVLLLQHELRERMRGPTRTAGATANVKIAVNNDSLATWFAKVIRRAADEINLRLEVIPDDQEFTEERLRSGEALAVVTTNEKSIPGTLLLPLGAMEYIGVASTEFASRHFAGGISLATVAKAPSISFDRKDTLPEQWLREAFGSSAPLSSHRIPSYEGHLRCCVEGVGWAIMPTTTVMPMVEAGDLMEIVPGSCVRVALQWQSRSQSSVTLSRLSDIVSEVASEELVTLEPATV